MNEIKNCVFNGIKWDAEALESVQTVAQGLLNLTELFKSQNIKIESLVKFDEKVIETVSHRRKKKVKKSAKKAE